MGNVFTSLFDKLFGNQEMRVSPPPLLSVTTAVHPRGSTALRGRGRARVCARCCSERRQVALH